MSIVGSVAHGCASIAIGLDKTWEDIHRDPCLNRGWAVRVKIVDFFDFFLSASLVLPWPHLVDQHRYLNRIQLNLMHTTKSVAVVDFGWGVRRVWTPTVNTEMPEQVSHSLTAWVAQCRLSAHTYCNCWLGGVWLRVYRCWFRLQFIWQRLPFDGAGPYSKIIFFFYLTIFVRLDRLPTPGGQGKPNVMSMKLTWLDFGSAVEGFFFFCLRTPRCPSSLKWSTPPSEI
jgi:hypothetical protein